MKLMRRRMAPAAAMFLVLAAVAGCSTAVPMRPAENAVDPLCAEIVVRLPDTIDEHSIRVTDAQGTGAWGDPAVILLTCGVDVPGPSTQRCITIDGVDWLVDDSDEDRGVFTTYGRDPAVQVVVDHVTSDSNALNELANAVGVNPASRACTDPADVSTGDDAVLEPEG
ncbi:MAG: hypothetical protein JWL94_1188 [Microbacteriaceae bacterium]|jgi:hypothetical protein|nr:hypothetical protein [Microbacteriaceae bacterium]